MHKGALILLVSGLLASMHAISAPRTVRVYQIDVRGENSPAALQEAMRHALVRATGNGDAGTDPALARIVADAGRFVQATRPAPQGGTLVIFDGEAVDREIASAGRVVWRKERPFILVTLDPPPEGGIESARPALESAAEMRGLPIGVVPLPVVDAAGVALDRAALLQAAQRFGGDGVLVGRGDSAALTGQWQWSLNTAYATETWTGSLDAGIGGAADALARAEQQNAAFPATESLVQIEGVASLTDYAVAERALQGIPGVEQVALREANGSSVVYSVSMRGGADALDRSLAGSTVLQRTGIADAHLVYQLRH